MGPFTVGACHVRVWTTLALPCSTEVDSALAVPACMVFCTYLASGNVHVQAVNNEVPSVAACRAQSVWADPGEPMHFVSLASKPYSIFQEFVVVFRTCDSDLDALVLFFLIGEDSCHCRGG